jgi:PIN domain nuclease of toxin-antitoxin system
VRLLLDTHTFVWWSLTPGRLPVAVHSAIAAPQNEVSVSAASVWEISIKHHAGKWPEVRGLLESMETVLEQSEFKSLPITSRHAVAAGALVSPHKDPFDRVLVAQARAEAMHLVSADKVFRNYDVPVLWSP